MISTCADKPDGAAQKTELSLQAFGKLVKAIKDGDFDKYMVDEDLDKLFKAVDTDGVCHSTSISAHPCPPTWQLRDCHYVRRSNAP